MHEELIPVIDKLEQAVADRNAQEIIAILADLQKTFIYSGNEIYERFEKIKNEMITVLFETINITEIFQLFLDKLNQKIYVSDIWTALETIADRVSFDALWTMKDYYGFPGSFLTPKLYSILSNEPNIKISEELIDNIERLANRESQEGTNYSEHQSRMSAFKYIRWNPDDGGLSDIVKLLGTRKDPVARAACKKYLLRLPWGTDRRATTSLLEGMSKQSDVEQQELFKLALSVHKEPIMLRLWIWRALFYTDPTETLLGVMNDFADYKKSEDLILLIDFLGNLFQYLQTEKKEFNEERVIAAAENVNTARWSFIVRGYYGIMLKTMLPKSNYRNKSSILGRGFVLIANIWDRIQLDHMGCVIPFLLMLGVVFFFLKGLDFLIGKAPKESPLYTLPAGFFGFWIAWAIVNMRTHFSGQKSLGQKFCAVLIYFGTLISAIVISILIRL
ncbi:MAG: hypothetical protein LBU34_04040 [Planctomycetaceae bacterium]|jgi:hypothetical protein|nr:hypothetical protein [Planctomycetaceae bacterium]